MLDTMMNSVKNYIPNLMWFAVAAFVAQSVFQLALGDGGYDLMMAVRSAVRAAAAAFMVSLIIGAMDNGS